ncbi:MAG: hypothetical protein NT086_15935 [Proteobacteria bacterium]|jgi:hypothetical protein|nr:hypothetical protein [Pseudomonadota bacterium]
MQLLTVACKTAVKFIPSLGNGPKILVLVHLFARILASLLAGFYSSLTFFLKAITRCLAAERTIPAFLLVFL